MLFTPVFWSLFFANFLTVASFSTFYLFPLFITDHGGSEGDIGVIMGVFALASALCRPWVSEMIDRMGRKKTYLFGAVIMAVLPLSYLGFLGGIVYIPLLGARIIHGIGLAICFTSVFTFIADIVPHERLNEGIGMFGISGLVGMAVGPVLAEGAIRHAGFTGCFLLASFLSTVALVLVFLLPIVAQSDVPSVPLSFFELLRRRKFIVVAFLSLIFGFALAATGNFVAPLAKKEGISFISIFYIVYSVGAVAIRFPGGRLTDHVGEKKIVPYALLIVAFGLFVLGFAHGEFLLGLAGFMAGCGHGLLFPSLNALAVRGETFETRGKATGIFTGCIDAGFFVGSIFLGWVGDLIGINSLFIVAGGVVLMGLFVKFNKGR